jgi:hypothetical protein
MANHSSIINNYKQSSKNSNMASIQRGKSSDFPHVSASLPEAREKPNALDGIRAEPSTSGQDLRSALRQELDKMEKADLVAITKTLLDDRIDFERQNIISLERINNSVRRTDQNLQAVRAVQVASRAMQPRLPHQMDQNRTTEDAKSIETPGVKVYHRVGTRQNDKGEPIVYQMSWSNVPRNELAQAQNKIVIKNEVIHPTHQSAKKTSKESGTKVARENFTDLPFEAQVKALDKVTSEICSIARQISDSSAAGDFKRLKELTARKEFMETHIKPKDSRDENPQSDEDDKSKKGNGDAPAKKASKGSDVKVVQKRFKDLPQDDKVTLLKILRLKMNTIACQMTDMKEKGDFEKWEELYPLFMDSKRRLNFMETQIKTKDSHHEKQRSDTENMIQPSWLGKEGYEDVTTEWCNILHATLSPNKSIPQVQNQKEVKKEVEVPCSCGGKCQIPLRQRPNFNPEGLTEIERKENARERWVAETLSDLAEDASQMLIQTPRRTKKQGLEVPDQRLQRTLEYIVTLSKGKGKGTPRPNPRAQGKGAVVSFEDELMDKLRAYSALLWENQESFEVDKRLLANVKRTLEWIEKLRLNMHEGPEDTEKIEAMKNWQWPKEEAPPAKASAAPAKTSARDRPAGK